MHSVGVVWQTPLVLARLSLPLRRIGALEGIVGFVTSLFLFITIASTVANPCGLCEPGRLSPSVDVAASILLVAAGIFLRVRRPRNAIWLLLVAAAWGRLIELSLVHLGEANVEVIWHSLRNLLLVAVPWHIAIVFPTGRALRGFRWLVAAWYVWAVTASTIRAFLVDWALMVSEGDATMLRPSFDGWEGWGSILAAVPRVSDALIVASIVAILVRWATGNRSVRRAFTPLFVVLPLLLADVFADLFGEGIAVLDGISIITQQVVAFALPATVVLGIVGPRIWEGKIARLIDDLETAVTLRQVEEATRSALEDRSVELLAWLPELGAWRDASGVLRDAPPGQMQTDVVLSGDLLGVICHDETSDLPLMSSVASTVALALRRIQLQAEVEARLEEVQRSRRRIVEAADEARRAIERDLHDGAQQRLVVLAMGLDLERGRFDDPEVHRVLEDAAEHARNALEEIRSLSRGMYPPALSSDGLQLAIEGLADASPVPTQIDVVEGRFDRRAETTAYFVVAESLANAAKHAQAKQIRVDVSSTGDALVVEVHDDGTGGATTRDAGGIEGLHDRVSAIGGKLEVLSPDLGGTTVRAVIPLEQADQRSG